MSRKWGEPSLGLTAVRELEVLEVTKGVNPAILMYTVYFTCSIVADCSQSLMLLESMIGTLVWWVGNHSPMWSSSSGFGYPKWMC